MYNRFIKRILINVLRSKKIINKGTYYRLYYKVKEAA